MAQKRVQGNSIPGDRPRDTTFLPQLERLRQAGISVVSLNISFDVVDPNDAFPLLATFRHWIRAHSEQYVLVDSVADIEAAKDTGRLAVMFNIEKGGNAVAKQPGLVEIFYRLGVRRMMLAYNNNNLLAGGWMDNDEGITAYAGESSRRWSGSGWCFAAPT